MIDYEKAMQISGPSKWLIRPSFNLSKKISEWNPLKLHNRFPIEYEGVLEEVEALMKTKAYTDEEASKTKT